MTTIKRFERKGQDVEIVRGKIGETVIYCSLVNKQVISGWVKSEKSAERHAKEVIDYYEDKGLLDTPFYLMPWYNRIWVEPLVKLTNWMDRKVEKLGRWFK